uniref:Uncharacterized protein n=1 Tax=Oryza punctata TaxID=4537 RepID=A0A0E0KNK9_ORYPU
MQTQVPTNTRERPTFTQLLLGEEDFDLPPYVPEAEENNQFYQQTMNENLNMNQLGNNGIETTELEPQEHIMTFASSFGIGSQLSGSQAIEVVDVVGGLTSQWGTQLHGGHLARVMSYIRAFHDPEQQIPPNLVTHQSIEPVLNHYAHSAEMSYSMRYPENITYGQINTLNNRNYEFHFLLEQAKNPENNSVVDPFGSRFIQHQLEKATPAELALVYEEIVPHACQLRGPEASWVWTYLLQKGTHRQTNWSSGSPEPSHVWMSSDPNDIDPVCALINQAFERVLEWCDDPEILKGLMSESVERRSRAGRRPIQELPCTGK